MTTKLDKTKIKCAVFDLDGTLLNTIKTINHYLNFALSAHDLPPVSEEDCRGFVGDGAVKLIDRALRGVGADLSLFDGIFKTYNEAYNASPYYLTEAYEGIKDTLLTLKEQGIKLAVLSNKPDFAVRAMAGRFFPDIFDIVYGGRDGTPLKPCPDALFDVMKELGVTPEETAYIGDSEVDILTAKNAGVALCISVTYGFRTKEQLLSAGANILVDNALKIGNLI